ncbi:hypothetical protein IMY05_008G0013400 [Salix suchowensis]|nr:hypothetical protein IMY05_008G0013400 [Salix suchowensis]
MLLLAGGFRQVLEVPFVHQEQGRPKNMGYLFLVLLLMLTSLSLFASSTPVHDHKSQLLSDSTTSKTDSLKERLGATGTHEHDNSSIGDDSSERSDRVHHGSFYGSEHGGGTSNGGGDDHGSGAAVVTGAAMNHHTSKHRNAGSHHANVIVLPMLITTALVALIIH